METEEVTFWQERLDNFSLLANRKYPNQSKEMRRDPGCWYLAPIMEFLEGRHSVLSNYGRYPIDKQAEMRKTFFEAFFDLLIPAAFYYLQHDDGNGAEKTRLTDAFRQVKYNIPWEWYARVLFRIRSSIESYLNLEEKEELDAIPVRDEIQLNRGKVLLLTDDLGLIRQANGVIEGISIPAKLLQLDEAKAWVRYDHRLLRVDQNFALARRIIIRQLIDRTLESSKRNQHIQVNTLFGLATEAELKAQLI